jgi:hypothetical protein
MVIALWIGASSRARSAALIPASLPPTATILVTGSRLRRSRRPVGVAAVRWGGA